EGNEAEPLSSGQAGREQASQAGHKLDGPALLFAGTLGGKPAHRHQLRGKPDLAKQPVERLAEGIDEARACIEADATHLSFADSPARHRACFQHAYPETSR